MAFDTYVKLDGITSTSQINIAGQPGKYTNYFEITDFSFPAANSFNPATPSSGAGKASLGPLALTMRPDTNTPILFADLCIGHSIATASLVCLTNTGGNTSPFPILQFDMTGVHIVSLALSGSDGDEHPRLIITLAFTSLTLSSTPQNADGTLGKPSTSNWNLTTNTPS